MRLTGDRLHLGGERRASNPWRILAYLAVIGSGVLLTRAVLVTKSVQPLFLATATPTRTSSSHAEEGRTNFSAGKLTAAIDAYQQAVAVAPQDGHLWAELARIQTYSSALMTTAEERRARLADARQAIEQGVLAAPDDAFVQAIRALVYDWSSATDLAGIEADRLLKEAEASAIRALQLDPGSSLAQAFYAEILLDQQKFVQSLDIAEQASDQADPLNPLTMDVHRVYGTVLESNGLYRQAIEEYRAAADINPNFTYLYLLIGANYRQLAVKATSEAERRSLMELALDSFDTAARINAQLEIADPTPYLAIGRTYLQDGEFFIAAINVERALAIHPTSPDIFGRLGIIFFKARNYETAVDVLRCAVEGCTEEEAGALLCDIKVFRCEGGQPPESVGAVPGLPLSDGTLEYYYTYASVLVSFRGTAGHPNACGRAEDLLQQVMAAYGSDPIVAGIVAENRGLCAGGLPAPNTTQTPTATPTLTPAPA
ncbi:MAG TPA: tetratricopeptide repeat protein [Anaerolineales bacterium]|nr:tetratricopeptide repeat protein [Anaerolineales bacterium]